MRSLFLILLAANLGYLGYTQWLAPNPAAAGSIAPRLPTIALASERPAQSLTSVATRCVAIGPYARPEEVSKAGRQLEDGGYRPSVRVSQGALRAYYSVVAAHIDSAAKATRALRRLRRAGFRDAGSKLDSSHRLAVQAGSYPDLASARASVAQAAVVGVPADVVEVSRTGTQYWLEFSLKMDSTTTPEALQMSLSSGGDPLQVQACEPSAAAHGAG